MTVVDRPVVSPRLLAALRQVAGRQWQLLAGRGLVMTMGVALGVWFLAAMVLGNWPAMPGGARWVVALLAWGTTVVAGFYFLRPAFGRVNLVGVAREIEGQAPEVDELLSSAVELSVQRDERFSGSPVMLAHLYRQAEQAAETLDARALVSMKSLKRWAMWLSPLLLLWVVALPVAPRPILGGLYRLLVPWKSGLPAALALVQITPGDATVPQGEGLTVAAAVTHRLGQPDAVQRANLICESAGGQQSSLEMNRTGDRQFDFTLAALDQSFRYRVTTEQGDSAWHAITVRPRPALAGVELRVTFPAYTKLPEQTRSAPDGHIEALTGSRVQVTIGSDQPLSDRSRLILAPGTAEQRDVPLSAAGDKAVRASLEIERSMAYRIELVNQDGISNKDAAALRKITAVPDQPPAVAILSPATNFKVRLEDQVPIGYRAEDDLGLSSLVALVQVDDKPVESFNVPISASRETQGQWTLSIPEQLARLKLGSARQISYQLKVTDNRQPRPQSTLSSKNVLQVDQALTQSLAARLEAQAGKQLAEAIKKAVDDLSAVEKKIEPLKAIDGQQLLSAAQRSWTQQARDGLSDIGRELDRSSRENMEGPFANLSRAALEIDDRLIRGAAEEANKALLNADQPQARQGHYAQAGEKTAEAKKQLTELLKQTQEQLKQHDLAKAVELLAEQQKKLAEQMKDDPARNAPLVAQQQQLAQRLSDLLSKNPNLQNPESQQIAQKLAETARTISAIVQEQKQLDAQINKETNLRSAEGKLDDLAREQRDLNRRVNQLAREQDKVVKQANAAFPQAGVMEAVAQKLEAKQYAPANAEQKQLVGQLNKDAEQLRQRSQLAAVAAQQAEQKQIEQAITQAGQLQKQVIDLKGQIAQARQAKVPEPQQMQQISQKVQPVVAAVSQQLAQVKAEEEGQQKVLEAAKAAVAKAQEELGKNNPDAAQQKLDESTQALAKLHHDHLAAAKNEQQQDKAHATQAMEQTRVLAQEQQALAARTAEAMKQWEAVSAAKPKQLQDVNALQQQAAQRLQQGMQLTQQLEQMARDKAPEIAQRARGAQAALQRATALQQQSTAARQQSVQQRQQASQTEQQARQQDAAADSLEQQAQQSRQQKQTAQVDQQQQQAKQQRAQAVQQRQQSKAVEQQAAKQQNEAEERQEQAHEQAARAEVAIRDLPGEEEDMAQGEEERPQGEEEAQQADADKGKGAKPTPSGKSSPSQAAAQLHEARQAQDETASTRRPEAAHQAAQALAKASQKMQQLDDASGSDAQASNAPGWKADQSGDKRPGQFQPNGLALDSAGMESPGVPYVDLRPDLARELGIAGSDWARLSPLAQQQLLHGLQQAGPPEYQEMIRSYYLRISRLHTNRNAE